MDSIRIDTGIKKIQINDGPEYLEFNPTDVSFVERFYQLIQDFEVKQAEYQKRAELIDAGSNLVDANGIPINFPAGIAMMREICEFVRGRIDILFGEGASQKLFGMALSLDAFGQFFTGITPFIKAARTEKVAKYQKRPHKKRVMS